MGKKLVSWLLLCCMLAGTFVPSMPVYAQEAGDQAVVSDVTVDAASEEIAEGNDAAQEFEEEVQILEEEETAAPEEDTEDPDAVSEDTEETIDDQEAFTEDAEETADDQEITEDEISEEVVEAGELEEEKLGDGLFYDNYKGDIGYLGDGCVTFETKPADIAEVGDVYLYASRTKDKKNPVYLGFKTLQDPTYFNETYYGDQFEKEYLKANKLDLHQAEQELTAGTWYLYAETKDGKPYGTNMLQLNVLPAPGQIEATAAAKAEDRSITVTREAAAQNSDRVYIFKKDTGFADWKSADFDASGIATFDEFAYAPLEEDTWYYIAYATPEFELPEGSLIEKEGPVDFMSPPAKVYIEKFRPSYDKIIVFDRETDDDISEIKCVAGQKKYLQVAVYASGYGDAPDQNVTFKSSDTKIFTVDAAGNITAKKAGSAILTVESTAYPDAKEELDVTVIELEKIKKITANPSKISGAADNGEMEISITTDAGVEGYIEWETPTVGEIVYTVYPPTSELDNGKATVKFKRTAGGVCELVGKVVAEKDGKECEKKTITIPVAIDGLSSAKTAAWMKGKQTSGWVAADGLKIRETGKKALALAREGAIVYYFDAATNQPAKGLWIIDKKYRYFDDNGLLVVGDEIPFKEIDDMAINSAGDVLTGWVDKGTDKYYYDPYQVKDSWVYDKAGKGYRFVDKNGKALSGAGLIKFNSESTNYSGRSFVFNENFVRQSGWVYLDAAGKITTKSKAVKFVYADPDTGIVKDGEFFRVGKKRYCASNDCSVRTGFFWDIYYYYADENGVIAENKFVTIDNVTYYAGEDGYIVEKTVSVPVFVCYDGKLCLQKGTSLCLEEDVKQASGLKLEDGSPVYYKSVSKKPSDGVLFYSDDQGKNKVKNAWLYDDEITNQIYYVNGSGKVVTGIVKIGVVSYYFDPETAKLSKYSEPTLVEYKEKKYWIEENGKVANDHVTLEVSGGHIVALVKKDGQPEPEGIYSYEGRKYPIGGNGVIINEQLASIKGKWYVINSDTDGWSTIVTRAADGFAEISGYTFWVCKDGSIKMGLVKDKSGKLYYCGASGIIYDGLVNIGGKLYYFTKDGSAASGWVYCKGDTDGYNYVYDSYSGVLYYYGPFTFYFDPKTHVAATGWKTMNAPALNSYGKLMLDASGRPIESGSKKKIYFVETEDWAPAGALAGYYPDYPDLTVGGKTYRFRMDGSPVTDRAVAEDADGTGFDILTTKDGSFAKGRTKVGNDWYYFDTETGIKETNVFRLSGGKWYHYGYDGRMNMNDDFAGVSTEYKTDGSIVRFMDTGGRTVKNMKISCDGYKDDYLIGPKGLPLTGFQPYAQQDDDGNWTAYFYCDSDGSTTADDSVNLYDFSLVPSGKKIYVVFSEDSMVYANASDKKEVYFCGGTYPSVNYARLGTADRDRLKRYEQYSTINDKVFDMCMKADGTLASNEVIDGKPVNTYGIFTEDLSPFYRTGSNWHHLNLRPGTTEEYVESYEDDKKIVAVISIDQNGNLKPVCRKDTGAKLNGLFLFFDEYPIYMKNGLPATGWQKAAISGTSYNLYFDPDCAIAIVLPGYG